MIEIGREAAVGRRRRDCEIADWDKFAALPIDVKQRVLEALGAPELDAATRLLLLRLEKLGVLKCL